MTVQVREWLPIEVATQARVRDAIGRVVQAWSADWFAGHALAATRFRPVADGLRLRGEGESWRAYRGSVAVSVTEHALVRLASWTLDAPLSRLELTPGDAAVVEALEHRVLDDLVERIEAFLGLPPHQRDKPEKIERLFDGQDSIEVAVTEPSGALVFSLALPFQAVLPLCKASLPKRKAPETDLDRLDGALGATPVTIEATLGHVEIGMVDLRKLSPGDVLILDRELDAGVRFDVPGSDTPFTVAYLGEAGGRMTLTLQSDHD